MKIYILKKKNWLWYVGWKWLITNESFYNERLFEISKIQKYIFLRLTKMSQKVLYDSMLFC